jgi:hypothetical protein
MSEETVEKAKVDVSKYNKLVEEANELGMKGYRPIASRFRDAATGEARVAALENSIKAFKSGLAAEEKQPGPPVQPDDVQTKEEEADMANSTARKTKTTSKSKGKAKVATKKVAKSKASQNARTRVATQKAPKEERGGIVGLFHTREGTNREKLLLALEAGKGKPVSIDTLLKATYGSKDEKNLGAIKMVLLGIDLMIDKYKLKYEMIRDGRGDEATFALVKK